MITFFVVVARNVPASWDNLYDNLHALGKNSGSSLLILLDSKQPCSCKLSILTPLSILTRKGIASRLASRWNWSEIKTELIHKFSRAYRRFILLCFFPPLYSPQTPKARNMLSCYIKIVDLCELVENANLSDVSLGSFHWHLGYTCTSPQDTFPTKSYCSCYSAEQLWGRFFFLLVGF